MIEKYSVKFLFKFFFIITILNYLLHIDINKLKKRKLKIEHNLTKLYLINIFAALHCFVPNTHAYVII